MRYVGGASFICGSMSLDPMGAVIDGFSRLGSPRHLTYEFSASTK